MVFGSALPGSDASPSAAKQCGLGFPCVPGGAPWGENAEAFSASQRRGYITTTFQHFLDGLSQVRLRARFKDVA